MNNLVYIDEYGLLGSNYYWEKHQDYGITKEELAKAGVLNGRLLVSSQIIDPLHNVDRAFQSQGYRLYIKDGYRPQALYDIVFQKRSNRFGQEATNRLVNMKDKPHSTGKTVDVVLWNQKKNHEVPLRDNNDGVEALFIDFYKNKSDPKSQHYQKLQEFIISTMLANGFTTGPKNEYFHFNYNGD